ncbi:MAG: prohibitin family protein [Acidobacteriota bacterium]
MKWRDIRAWIGHSLPYLIMTALILLFAIVFFAPRIFIVVHSGEAGVFYRMFLGGTVTDRVYGEGLHIIFPWNKMYVYNVRLQERGDELDVLTKNGLRLHLKLSIRFYPERDVIAVLHQRIGPDYVDKIIIPSVESIVRQRAGEMSEQDVYTTQHAFVQSLLAESYADVGQSYLKIHAVIVREVRLPEPIQKAIEQKLEQEQLAAAYVYRLDRELQEAKRKAIEADGYKMYNDTVNLSLTPALLKWKGIEATKELAQSPNTKVIVVGNGDQGLPVLLSGEK